MGRRGRLLVLMAMTGVAAALPTAAHGATYSGRFACDDRGEVVGMPGARVEIWDRGWEIGPPELMGHVFARGFTDEDGYFRLDGPARDAKVFARVVFQDALDVTLNDWATPWIWANDSQLLDARNGDVDFRQITLTREQRAMGSPRCAVFRGVHKARLAWAQEIGGDVPDRIRPIGWNYPNAATFGQPPPVPFTLGTGIKWPDDAVVDAAPGQYEVARHEFGHTIRHGFDGDVFHFLQDVGNHDYLRQHGDCARFNERFAFNEGWANYWAGRHGDPGCNLPLDDYVVEGNVAYALKRLELRCAGGDRRIMVDVLRRYPGGPWPMGIHTYRQFEEKLGCPSPGLDQAPDPGRTVALAPAPPPPTVSRTSALTNIERSISSLRRKGVSLIPSPRIACSTASACIRRVGRPLRSIVLGAQLTILRRQRSDIALIDSTSGRARLRRMGTRAAWRYLLRREAALERDLERVQRTMARSLLRLASGRPGLARIATGARRVLRALDRRGASPVRLALPSFERPRYVPLPVLQAPQPAPAEQPRPEQPQQPQPEQPQPEQPQPEQPQPQQPQPQPQPEPSRKASSLSLSCPSSGRPKGTAAWSGQLSPEMATTIAVTLTRPDGTSTSGTAPSDASGAFGGSFETTTPGTWKLTASWAGDAGHTGSSAACEVPVG